MTHHRHIVALDFMSLVHPLTYKIENIPDTSMIPYLLDKWVQFFANPILYTPISNPVGFSPFEARPILCLDLKNDKGKYWRHRYLSTYKTGRRAKSPLLCQVRDTLLQNWVEAGLPTLGEPGFEADDWAGALVRHSGPDTKIALVTVDSDWAMLVGSDVMWLDVYPPERRNGVTQKKSVLGADEVLERFNNQKSFQRTRLITNPYDLADHKHQFGDKSDRIPEGRVVDPGVIDLKNPCQEPTDVANKIRSVLDWQYPKLSIPYLNHYHFGIPSWVNDSEGGLL